MDAASFLLAVSLGLLLLEGAGHLLPAVRGPGRVALCAAGALAALATAAPGGAGLLVALDGVSRAILLALFLLGAAGWQRPAVLGAAAVMLLAANAAAFVFGAAVCGGVAVAGLPREPSGAGGWGLAPTRATALRLLIAAIAGLAAALLLQGGFALQFTAMRGQPAEGVWGALLLALVLGSGGLLFVALPAGLGGMLGVYAVARLLLDLPGPVTPAWWGAPILLAGVAGALWGGWRASGASSLAGAVDAAGVLATGVAVTGLGAGLLARGADVVPAASLAVSGALGAVLAWGAWGGLLCLCVRVVGAKGGGTELARLGGLLRRAPGLGLALGLGLGSMAAAPASAGFAGAWPVLQAVFAAGRTGGEAALLVAAAVAAGLGLAVALAGMAAVRLAAAVLAGAPRSARAGALVDPPGHVRLALAGYAALVLLAGVLPGPLLWLVQPGVRMLAGAGAEGAGLVSVSVAADAPGYVAAPLALVMLAAVSALAWVLGPVARSEEAAWNGGFADPDAARGDPGTPPPRIRLPDRAWSRAALVAAAGALCMAVGWAAGLAAR